MIHTTQLSSLSASPLVSRERFAEMVGVSRDTVCKWIDRGYIPVVNVGRWSLVNVALLTVRCLEKEFKPLSDDSMASPVQPVTAAAPQRASARSAVVAG